MSSKPFCSLPWNGIHVDQNLDVFPCCLAAGPSKLGNLKDNTIEEIVDGPLMTSLREKFLAGEMPRMCKKPCGGKTGDIINKFTAQERAEVFATNNTKYLGIRRADLRTSNLCTLGCVYCNSLWSSTIADREGKTIHIPTANSLRKNQLILEQLDLSGVQELFLAGGEPLIMKENLALLKQVLEHNPQCRINVNTGLSVLRGPVYNLLSELPNVGWMVSVDTTDPQRFEYIRHGNTWKEFVERFETICKLPGHDVSVHSVYFALSYKTFAKTIKDLQSMGSVAVVVDPVSYDDLDLRNLPNVKEIIDNDLQQLLDQGLILSEAYQHIKHSLERPMSGSLERLHGKLAYFDQTFGMDSRSIFPELYADNLK